VAAGTPISSYTVEVRGRNEENYYEIPECSLLSSRCFVKMDEIRRVGKGLKEGDLIIARVRAINEFGAGPYSSVNLSTGVKVRSAPGGITGLNIDSQLNLLRLSWD